MRSLGVNLRGGAGALFAVILCLLFVPLTAQAFNVTGHVENGVGQPLPNIEVRGVSATGAVLTTTTAVDGNYTLFVPPGTYDIEIRPAEGVLLVGVRATEVVVMSDVVQNAVLTDGVFVFGTVRNPGAAPVPGVDVDMFVAGTATKVFTPYDESDALGFFAVVVPTGTYDVVFEPPAATSLLVVKDAGVVVASDTLHDRTLPAGHIVSGLVEDVEGDPLTDVGLKVFVFGTATEVPISTDQVDSGGNYAFVVPTGTYDVKFEAPPGTRWQDTTANGVLVVGPTTLNRTFEFQNRLEGVVRNAALQVVANVEVKALDPDTGASFPAADNLTDGLGEYRVDVPSGLVDLIFIAPPSAGGASFVLRNQNITGDLLQNVTLPAGFTLSGRVTNAQGMGVANVDLDFEDPVTGKHYPVFNDDTNVLGDYSVVLPADTYSICVDAGAGVPLVAEFHTGISVPATSTFDMQLATGVFVSGRVLDTVNNPWPGIDIDVHLPGGGAEIVTHRDKTDAAGDYSVVVAPGTYDFFFTPPLGIPVTGDVCPDVVVLGNMTLDKVLPSTVIGVADAGPVGAPSVSQLGPNRPNPFNPSTELTFDLTRASTVRLSIYDATGRAVRRLVEASLESGRHSVRWDGRDDSGRAMASGVYFAAFDDGVSTLSRKLVLAR